MQGIKNNQMGGGKVVQIISSRKGEESNQIVSENFDAITWSRKLIEDFPGGTVDKNLSANAGDMGLIPGRGRFHLPWGN